MLLYSVRWTVGWKVGSTEGDVWQAVTSSLILN